MFHVNSYNRSILDFPTLLGRPHLRMSFASRRRPLFAFLFAFVLALAVWAPQPLAARELSAPGIADGAGLWITMWDYPSGDLDAYCTNLRANGVRNVFIQTSRSNTAALVKPAELGALIEACHRHQIRIVAWSYALLHSPIADAEKMVAAAEYTSPAGERLDGIAPNLENNLEQWRVELYSKHLREKLGNNYPLMAVVYSPLNKAPEVARTPWRILAKYYDVIAPMAYWNSKWGKLDAYEYTVETVQRIRELTARPDVEIHVIGDGMGTRKESILMFMNGCKRAEATSASIYPNHKITPEQLSTMSRYSDYFQPNARIRLAAFKEMVTGGHLNNPPLNDPSQPINRGDFYSLVCKQLVLRGGRTKNDQAWRDLSQLEAYQLLMNSGLLPQPAKMGDACERLILPIQHNEASTLIAKVIDLKRGSNPQHRGGHRNVGAARHNVGALMGSGAAMAQPQPATSTTQTAAKAVNYLDAAHMVLQARSSL